MEAGNDTHGIMIDGQWFLNPPLREGELEYLMQFRAALEAEGIAVPQDEWMLVRFLRARGCDGARDIPASVEMLRNSLEWRRTFGTDRIFHDFDFPEREKVAELYIVGYFNTTRQGIPVYIERLGALDVPKLYEITTQERLLGWHVASYEEMLLRKLPACSKAHGERVVQSFTILDLEGCSMGDLMNRDNHRFLGAIAGIDQDNYPEMMHRMFIINAPSMFSMAWQIIKRFLDPNTTKKISIHSRGPANYMSELQEYVDIDKLPKFIGGTHPDENWPAVQPGPWQEWQPEVPVPPPLETEKEARTRQNSRVDISKRKDQGFTAGKPARSSCRQLGRNDSLVKAIFKRKKACDEPAAGEVEYKASDQDTEASNRPRSSSKGDEATQLTTQYFDPVWANLFGEPNDEELEAVFNPPPPVVPCAVSWEDAARRGDVTILATLLAEGVAPNYEGNVQVKLRGGLLPHWAVLYVSVTGGVVVCREEEFSEDALAPSSLLQAQGVQLNRTHYVKVDGILPHLELYHEDEVEVLVWFTSLQCSLLLAYHAPQLAGLSCEEQRKWWLSHLRSIEVLTERQVQTGNSTGGGIMSKARSALKGLIC